MVSGCRMTAPTRTLLSLWLVGLLLVAVPFTVATAVNDHAPREPVNIYGTAADETGNPVPVGTTIHAVVDGESRSSVTVDEPGAVGGPGAFADRLVVDTGAGDEVRFAVGGPDGPTAFETLPLDNTTAITDVTLTFPGGLFADPVVPDEVSLSLADTRVAAGENTSATVTATFADGVQTEVTDTATVETLDPGVVTVENGTILGVAGGTATVRAGYTAGNTTRTDTATVTVETVEEPVFEVTTVDAPATAAPGETLPVDATITNTGDTAGTATVTHEFRREPANETTVELGAGEETTVTFVAVAPDSATNVTHTVRTPDDSVTVTTIIREDTGGGDDTDDSGGGDDGESGDGSTDGTDEESDDASGPGFGPLAVVVALALCAWSRLPKP